MTREEDIKKAVEVLRKGGIILYPTDTIWGIGCDATNAEAVAKVYQIKQRDDSKAMICLVDSATRMQRYVRNVPNVAWDLVELATKPTTLILDDSQKNCVTAFKRLWLAPVPTLADSPQHKITRTLAKNCSTPSTTYAGPDGKNTSHIRLAASSS